MDPEQERVADLLHSILSRHEGTPIHRRLKVRVSEQGRNQTDEVEQFRQLQRACRMSPELAGELQAAGLGEVTTLDWRRPSAETALLIQGFNRMIEKRWEKP